MKQLKIQLLNKKKELNKVEEEVKTLCPFRA